MLKQCCISPVTVVTAHEFLRQQGSTYIVFHPGPQLLYLGFGCDEAPRVVPNCIAYHDPQAVLQQAAANSNIASWRPDDRSYDVLTEAHRALHLPAPPSLQQVHQQQQQPQQQQNTAGQALGVYPAAKAGVISSKETAEGSDGFAWSNVHRAHMQQQQQQQQQQQAQAQLGQQQRQQPGSLQAEASPRSSALQASAVHGYIPYLAASQVARLWRDEAYTTTWLMTEDGHINGLGSVAEHLLLERFEAVWGWGLAAELGLSPAQRRQLSAVLLVPHDMNAAEVRFLADVLLDRLGFASLVAHLEPVAATFGNAATSACVINISSRTTTIVCIDDAVLLPPASSRITIPIGLATLAATLTGWMSYYGHWPQELVENGLGPGFYRQQCAPPAGWIAQQQQQQQGSEQGSQSEATGPPAYEALMLEELAMQQCYCPKASLTPGLLGQALLEECPPAVVPLRAPGKPTVTYQVSLGSWAAVAPMVWFYPGMALPSCQQPQQQQSNAEQGATRASPTVSASSAASNSNKGYNDSSQHQYYHNRVHDMPAAESMYLQGQLKARLEAGEIGPPSVGLYLPPLDMPAAIGDRADEGNDFEAQQRIAATRSINGAMANNDHQRTPIMQNSMAADAQECSTEAIALDEAVFRSITAAAVGRPDVFDRLSAGLLLIGPGAGIRGLGSMLERRLGVKFAQAGRHQLVSVLEPKAYPAHIAWKGGALLAALDSGRENWLPKEQWVQGGMAFPSGNPGKPGAGHIAGGSLANAAAGRHAKLCYYLKAEQGA